MCATCTSRITAVSAPSRRRKAPTSALSAALATYGRINRYGFIETPYRKVKGELDTHSAELVGRKPLEDVKDSKGKLLLEAGVVVTSEALSQDCPNWRPACV